MCIFVFEQDKQRSEKQTRHFIGQRTDKNCNHCEYRTQDPRYQRPTATHTARTASDLNRIVKPELTSDYDQYGKPLSKDGCNIKLKFEYELLIAWYEGKKLHGTKEELYEGKFC